MKNQLFKFTKVLAVMLLATNLTQAQRYLTEVFASTIETTDVSYGENYSVLTGSPILQTLNMDIYEPSGDLLTERPLIMLLHTGSFLPTYINQFPVGSKGDSSIVELARRYARMGYVVAVPDYRNGWNPQGTQDERTETYINAIYRGLQDAKTCTRWFRKDVDLNSNTYGVDTSKIAIGGQGTGGYISLAYSSIDELAELQLTKFFNFTTNAFMIDTSLVGDWNGFGGNPGLNVNNHTGYSSDVNVVFNMGGAIGDSTWINAGEVPIISLHGISDAFAPFDYGIYSVEGTTLFVLDVSGSSDVIRINNTYGNNDVFYTPPITDAFTTRADEVNTSYDLTYGNDGDEGLFAFEGATDGTGPWEFWDDATVNAEATLIGMDPSIVLANGYAANPAYQALGPVAGKARAMAFMDTIVGYTAPRLYRVLYEQFLNVDELTASNVNITLSPNPAQSEFKLFAENKARITKVELVDLMGKSYLVESKLNKSIHTVNIDQLPSGIYIVNVTTNLGSIRRKLVKR